MAPKSGTFAPAAAASVEAPSVVGDGPGSTTKGLTMSEDDVVPVVVVGWDGSLDSRAALQWARTYASATDSVLHLITAWTWPAVYGAPVALEGYDPEADAGRLAEEGMNAADLPAGRVHTRVVQGAPRTALVDASRSADLLVVGSQGHTALGGVLIGSVSAYCVRHADIPVVVVR